MRTLQKILRLNEIIDLFKSQNSNWFLSLCTKFVLFISIFTIAYLAYQFQSLPPQVPLFYSLPWGQDRLVPPIILFLLPSASLFWHVINILATSNSTDKHLVFAQLLYGTSLFVSCMSLFIVINIISLVL